jgi:hypothetical protein
MNLNTALGTFQGPTTKTHSRTYYCSTHPDTGKRRVQSAKPFGWDEVIAYGCGLFQDPHTVRATSYTDAREQDACWCLFSNLGYPK